DEHARRRQQLDLLRRLDRARLQHQLLAVDDLEPAPLEREEDLRLDDVDAERLALEAVLAEDGADLAGDVVAALGAGRHRAAERRDPGRRAPVEPRAVERVVARRRTEVPEDRLAAAR